LQGVLDFELVGLLIKKHKANLAEIAGRDVIVVLGETGVGKSLFINWLLGKTIQACQELQEDGFEVYKTVL